MTQPDDWIASQQDWAAWAANCSAPMADQPPYPYYGDGVGPLPELSVPSTYQPDLVFMLLCVITLSSEIPAPEVRYFGLTCLLVLFDTAWHKNADNGRAPYGPLTVTCHGVRMILPDYTSSIDMRKIGSVCLNTFIGSDNTSVMLQMRIYALYRNIRLVILNGAMFVTGVVAMVVILYGFDPVTFLAILHDSIKYFVLISTTCAVLWNLTRGQSFCGLGDLAIPFVMASHTVGGSRLILHLRETYYDRLDPSMDSKNAALSFAIEEIQQQAPPFVRSIVDASFFVPEHVATDHDAAADGSST
ncbi:hypothetical protein EXIGLDRAFT_817206 [Exidia glandulosa HHB12029]|uniref:Uncharacterized protein n=1 Tax=Exidia glandulosa HHB12029 TaxID=1314781 RepID=A0A166AYN3_EXIGL|nr:hypothetical protein EXIGLDRAFT_817206 [Exidia glandulosa HHB12029]